MVKKHTYKANRALTRRISHKNKRAFTIIEVLVAMAIALIMLTALLSLEIRSTLLASRVIMGFEALPYAIDRLEEVSEQEFSGTAQEFKDNFEIRTMTREAKASIPLTQIEVEVLQNGESCSSLSMYKFKIQ